MECVDGVGAGEEEPVVSIASEGVELGEGGVEWVVGFGGDDFDGGDEDRGSAEGFKLVGEVGGLMAGPGDEDALVVEGGHSLCVLYVCSRVDFISEARLG